MGLVFRRGASHRVLHPSLWSLSTRVMHVNYETPYSFNTMATTYENCDTGRCVSPEGRYISPEGYDVPMSAPSVGFRDLYNHLSQSVTHWYYNSIVTRWLCCANKWEYDNAMLYERAYSETRAQMRESMGYANPMDVGKDFALIGGVVGNSLVVGNTKFEVPSDTSSTIDERVVAVVPELVSLYGVTRPTRFKVASAEQQPGYVPPVVPAPIRSRLYPAFASRAALFIHSKVGPLAHNEPNRLVADRVYTAMCRDAQVRHNVSVMHRELVMRAYFELTDAENWSTMRHRLPKFARFERASNLRSSVPKL